MLVGWLSDKTHSFAAGEYFYAIILLVGSAALILGTEFEHAVRQRLPS